MNHASFRNHHSDMAACTVGIIVMALVALTHCGSHDTTVRNAAKSGLYGEQLDRCVAESSTKAQSQKCRCEVSTSWGRPCDEVKP